MPWRLIVSIVIFAIFLAFITFNLDNRCDLSIGFVKFEEVPVFLTVFVSFVFGLICSLAFSLFMGRNRVKTRKEKIEELDAASPRNNDSIAERRKKFMRSHGGGSNETY